MLTAVEIVVELSKLSQSVPTKPRQVKLAAGNSRWEVRGEVERFYGIIVEESLFGKDPDVAEDVQVKLS